MQHTVHLPSQGQVVGHHQEGGLERAAQLQHQFLDTARGVLVEVAGRLVEQYQRRTVDQRARNGHPLTFAAGQLGRLVGEPVAEADPFEQRDGAAAGVAAAFQFQRQHDVLRGGEAVEQLEGLEHEADVLGAHPGALVLVEAAERLAGQHYLAATGQVEPGEQAEQGRLARARAADDGQRVAAGQLQGEGVEEGQFAFRAGDHFAKVARRENAGAHGESDGYEVVGGRSAVAAAGPAGDGRHAAGRRG